NPLAVPVFLLALLLCAKWAYEFTMNRSVEVVLPPAWRRTAWAAVYPAVLAAWADLLTFRREGDFAAAWLGHGLLLVGVTPRHCGAGRGAWTRGFARAAAARAARRSRPGRTDSPCSARTRSTSAASAPPPSRCASRTSAATASSAITRSRTRRPAASTACRSA